jgi:Zn-dependent M16 (insulinase) family peptidase
MFYLEATVEKYLEAVASMRDILFHVEFTEERVRTVISQLLNGIPGDKLSASVVVKSLADNMFFKKNNNVHFSSFLRQQKFLNASLNSLKVDPQHMLERLTRIKNSLVRPENCLAFMSTDLDRLQQVVGKNGAEAWQSFFPNATRRNNLLRRETSREIEIIPEYANRNMSPKLRHAIIGLPGTVKAT